MLVMRLVLLLLLMCNDNASVGFPAKFRVLFWFVFVKKFAPLAEVNN